MRIVIALLLAAALAAGCSTSSNILIGKPRPPIDPSLVRIYSTPPAKFEEVAVIEANSRNSMAFGDQEQTSKVIERLKKEAATLGANGVLLKGVGETGGASVGTGLGSATASGSGGGINILGASIGLSTDLRNKTRQGHRNLRDRRVAIPRLA
jgi:hypothetical protein